MPRSRALPVAQVSLITLPDELLGGILQRAWADRPPCDAREEVRTAAGLASVCRRWRALLRAPPLPLALVFSAVPLSAAQRRWLLDPAQAGRVEAASFHVADALWERSLVDRFLALHGATLLRLSGVPLQLVACASQEEWPALDLSGLRLTRLGVDCGDFADLYPMDSNPWAGHVCFCPERLPGTLEELELLGLHGFCLEHITWAPQPEAGLAGRLPQLHTLRISCTGQERSHTDRIPLLEGFPVLPALQMDSSEADIDVNADLFGRVRSLRIVAGDEVRLWEDSADVATFVDRLCPAGLQGAELCAKQCIALPSNCLFVREVVREMTSRFGDRFAVEVGVPEQSSDAEPSSDDEHEQYWNHTILRRLAWRRWPAPGAPGLQAARAAHKRARAWALEAER